MHKLFVLSVLMMLAATEAFANKRWRGEHQDAIPLNQLGVPTAEIPALEVKVGRSTPASSWFSDSTA